MFWKFTSACNINSLLDKGDVTLQQIMDDDDVLQECKGQNVKLIEFLCKPEIVDQLVDLIISEPAGELQEPVKYKYSNTACEILVSDVAQLNDALGDNDTLREKLFSFLDHEPPLNPLLASFFSKVVGILLSRKPEPTLDFIKVKDDFVGTVLSHLGTSAIMDLLLRLVTCVEAPNLRARVLSWLNENRLVERLIALINPAYSEDFHFNSSQALCDIIRLSREHMFTMQESAQEDPLLNTLEKQETVELLLKHMFDYGINESVTINGVSVLLALLEIRRPAPFGFPEMAPELTPLDVERLANGVSRTLKGLGKRLDEFIKLLTNPPKKEPMNCTFGPLDPPLGNTRLHVVKLISAILITNTPHINQQLSELQVFNTLLDLFFRYEYNNFLHTQVVNCLQTILSHTASMSADGSVYTGEELSIQERKEDDDLENPRKIAPLLTHIFEDCRLLQRILDAWNENRNHEEGCGQRKGYMGHLTIISNQIIETMDKGRNSDKIKAFIEGMAEDDQDRWGHFVGESLAEINEKNSSQLGGHNPKARCSDDDGDADYSRFDSSGQQAFNDYQLQQITSNFSDQFGFTDTDYAESDDVDKFSKINQVDFDIKADTDTESRLQFEKYCTSKIPTIDDHLDEEENGNDIFENDDGDDDWANTNTGNSIFENSSSSMLEARPRCPSADSNEGDDNLIEATEPASKQPEEMDTSTPSERSDIKSEQNFKEVHQNTPHPVDNPWFDDNQLSTSDDNQPWANFDDFQSEKRPVESEEQNLSGRASNYAVLDMPEETGSTFSEQQASTITSSANATTSTTGTTESMEFQQSENKSVKSNTMTTTPTPAPVVQTSTTDVVMEVLEDINNKTSSQQQPTTTITSSTHNVAMEVDVCQSNPIESAKGEASIEKKPEAVLPQSPSKPAEVKCSDQQPQQKQEQDSSTPQPSTSTKCQQQPPSSVTSSNITTGKEAVTTGNKESGNGEPCSETPSQIPPASPSNTEQTVKEVTSSTPQTTSPATTTNVDNMKPKSTVGSGEKEASSTIASTNNSNNNQVDEDQSDAVVNGPPAATV